MTRFVVMIQFHNVISLLEVLKQENFQANYRIIFEDHWLTNMRFREMHHV